MLIRRNLFTLITIVIFLYANCSYGEYSLPSSRKVDWSLAGTTNTIPSTGTVVDITQSPYNVPTDGTSDCTSAINNALSSISSDQVAYLPAGTYMISGDIVIPSNKVLRGAGQGSTIIKGMASYSGTWIMVGMNQTNSVDTGVNLSGSYSKGDTVITTSVAHNLSAGDIVILDKLNDTSGDPPVDTGSEGCSYCGRTGDGTRIQAQMNRVASVQSTTQFTLETPLHFDLESTLTPQVAKQNGYTVNAGLESLTVDNSVSQYDRVVGINFGYNCWIYNVEVNYSKSRGIYIEGGYRCTVRKCKVHETSTPLSSNSGYGIVIYAYNSNLLIEDNIVYQVSNPFLNGGPFTGCVIAYNYFKAHTYTGDNRQNGACVIHAGHPCQNLFEGNYFDGYFTADTYHGSSSHNVFFRNRIKLQSLSGHAKYPIDVYLNYHHQYYSVIGCILGEDGVEQTYEYENDTIPSNTSTAIYNLGYYTADDLSPEDNDPDVKATLLRHQNFDYVNDSILTCTENGENADCQDGLSDTDLPNSFYLDSKPSWWDDQGGCRPWPPIGPDVSGYSVDIPAKDRYEGQVYNCGSFDGITVSGGISTQ